MIFASNPSAHSAWILGIRRTNRWPRRQGGRPGPEEASLRMISRMVNIDRTWPDILIASGPVMTARRAQAGWKIDIYFGCDTDSWLFCLGEGSSTAMVISAQEITVFKKVFDHSVSSNMVGAPFSFRSIIWQLPSRALRFPVQRTGYWPVLFNSVLPIHDDHGRQAASRLLVPLSPEE